MKIKGLICFLLLSLLTGCNDHDTVGFQGYVEGENIYLASPNSGKLISLAVKRGELVKKNQFLFQLDPEPQSLVMEQYKDAIDEANHLLKDLMNPSRTPEISAIQAQIEQVDADLQLAKVRVHRYQELQDKNAIDKDALDAAIANLTKQQNLKNQYTANLALARLGGRQERIEAQKEQISSLTAKYNEAKWQWTEKRLLAPVDGIIFDTYFQEGEFVPGQQAVLSLLNPTDVYIEFFVPVHQMARLKLGQRLRVECDGCHDSTSAFISYISPEAQYTPPLVYSRENSDKLVFRVKARLPKGHNYKPGQPVMVFEK